jgi:hypothetical protein
MILFQPFHHSGDFCFIILKIINKIFGAFKLLIDIFLINKDIDVISTTINFPHVVMIRNKTYSYKNLDQLMV